MSTVPLAVYPWDAPPEVVDTVRSALASLRLPFVTEIVKANPGEPGRILALGAIPPFVCDCAPVTNPLNEDSVRNAIRWVLTAPPGDENGYLVLDYLQAAFGPGTRFLGEEPVEQKVRFGE